MSSPFKENWDEFDWEKELRKDDERVHAYMGALPRYIDLPDEDGVIMKQIQRRPELIPHGGAWPPQGEPWDDEDADQENDGPLLSDDWQKRDGAEVYTIAACLTRDFCIFNAYVESPEDNRVFMQILCSLGMIMARTADIIDMEPGEVPNLRIALGKRLLASCNYILGKLSILRDHIESQSDNLDYLTEQIQLMRERILALMERARNPENGTSGNENNSF